MKSAFEINWKMKQVFALFVVLLSVIPAAAQTVQYVGPITPNHLGGWVKAGIMGDGGLTVVTGTASSDITASYR